MKKPVCRLNVALYGHPDSGTEWEHHCDDPLKKSGFINVGDGAWPSCYVHKELDLLLSVYVDEFKLAGPAKNMSKGWQLIVASLELDPPLPLSLYLGCIHGRNEMKVGSSFVQVMAYNMEGFLKSSV